MNTADSSTAEGSSVALPLQNITPSDFRPPGTNQSATTHSLRNKGKERARLNDEDESEPALPSGRVKSRYSRRGEIFKEPDLVSNEDKSEDTHRSHPKNMEEVQPGVQNSKQGK